MPAQRSSELPPKKPDSALQPGEVRFLEVTALIPKGALVDAGLERPLLVPHAEQTFAPEVGSRQPIALYQAGRGELAGTMKVSELLREPEGEFELDQWVEGEAYRNDPNFGLFVIVERSFIGLVPASEPHRLARGEAARFRVTSVLEDGRVELSLRDHAHQEIDRDAEVIVEVLGQKPAPKVGDHSDPQQIRQLFRLSKKAFKRAVGRLLRRGELLLDESTGVLQLAPPRREPARPAVSPARPVANHRSVSGERGANRPAAPSAARPSTSRPATQSAARPSAARSSAIRPAAPGAARPSASRPATQSAARPSASRPATQSAARPSASRSARSTAPARRPAPRAPSRRK